MICLYIDWTENTIWNLPDFFVCNLFRQFWTSIFALILVLLARAVDQIDCIKTQSAQSTSGAVKLNQQEFTSAILYVRRQLCRILSTNWPASISRYLCVYRPICCSETQAIKQSDVPCAAVIRWNCRFSRQSCDCWTAHGQRGWYSDGGMRGSTPSWMHQ